jgi:SAM-dependent methyltransferase
MLGWITTYVVIRRKAFLMSIADRLVPLQTQLIRPLALAAEESSWVPRTLVRGLRRLDGTCALAVPAAGAAKVARSNLPSVRHPITARLYAGQAAKAEGLGLAERRRELLAPLSGRVLEIGAGTGANFAHYPPSVEHVVAVEPERFLRRCAVQAAAGARVPVTVVDAAAEQLPFEDAHFDGAVASLVLCSVGDPARALAELCRVIRPGGRLRFNEHVRSGSPRVARLQRTVDALGWPRVSGGCHLGRDTEALIRAAGFEVGSVERYRFGMPPLDPPKPHVLGSAWKPHPTGH